MKAPLPVIFASMHLIAEQWAARNNLAKGEFCTVTDPARLVCFPVNAEIIVVDSGIKFRDSRGIYAALARFTNIRRVSY